MVCDFFWVPTSSRGSPRSNLQFHEEASKRNIVLLLSCWVLLDRTSYSWACTPCFSIIAWCNNIAATYLLVNHVQHDRIKHFRHWLSFCLWAKRVASGDVRVRYVSKCHQLADILTNNLLSTHFEDKRSNLTLQCPTWDCRGVLAYIYIY